MDNLPYYLEINDKHMREQVIWKHKYFIEFFNARYSNIELFKKYKELVGKVV